MGLSSVGCIEPTSVPWEPRAFPPREIVDGPCLEVGGYGTAVFEPADVTLKTRG
jgi:hypothetical protein